MAKGNLLLGTAGNSVGDVVMYRREGAQVSRVRVRKIKNPKTDAQSLQRAAFSPVAKFYSPLAVVLERSFEGLSKMMSYSKFLKTNVDLARANGWLLPKGTGFFPLPYKLSQGTLQSVSVSELSGSVCLDAFPNGEASTVADISQEWVDLGYKNGDVVTFIAIVKDGAGNFHPETLQFIIDTASTEESHSWKMGAAEVVYESKYRITVSTNTAGLTLAGGAVIVARFENEKWRRSTQSLLVMQAILTQISSDEYKASAVASYGPNAGEPNPLVYLDGDTLEG